MVGWSGDRCALKHESEYYMKPPRRVRQVVLQVRKIPQGARGDAANLTYDGANMNRKTSSRKPLAGRVAVLGPPRMQYERTMAAVSQVARIAGEAISRAT